MTEVSKQAFFPSPPDKDGLKINSNNLMCENMDQQSVQKKNSGLHEKCIYMKASFHTVLEIKNKGWNAGSEYSGCFEAIS